MPTVTKDQIDRDEREHKVRGQIMRAIKDVNLTPSQAMYVLAGMLAEYTLRAVKHEEQELADARACLHPRSHPTCRDSK